MKTDAQVEAHMRLINETFDLPEESIGRVLRYVANIKQLNAMSPTERAERAALSRARYYRYRRGY